MGIKKDAGELLFYSYNKYVNGTIIMSESFLKDSGWNKIRARNAVAYLDQRGLVNVEHFSQSFLIDKILPNGIDIIEDVPKFTETFGFSINLGLIEFSWTQKNIE